MTSSATDRQTSGSVDAPAASALATNHASGTMLGHGHLQRWLILVVLVSVAFMAQLDWLPEICAGVGAATVIALLRTTRPTPVSATPDRSAR